MKLIRPTNQNEVFNHWGKVENIDISQGDRSDIVSPLLSYADLQWNLFRLEDGDLSNIYIISSDDWKDDGVCVPDFKLMTAIKNYRDSMESQGKFADIAVKEQVFKSNSGILDTKLIIVSVDQDGPFTLIEGNKRSIALGNLGKLAGLEVYLGSSPAIKNYVWSRYSK
ncbi:hypothetical protein KKF92_00090 [Patescibacteria group bacterium]|nr:hypothetical protein [Patescibacteria group bacterium]